MNSEAMYDYQARECKFCSPVCVRIARQSGMRFVAPKCEIAGMPDFIEVLRLMLWSLSLAWPLL
jgi:hypothetical protein